MAPEERLPTAKQRLDTLARWLLAAVARMQGMRDNRGSFASFTIGLAKFTQ